MDYRMIKSPSQCTIDILLRRKGSGKSVELSADQIGAVGLIQGKMIDMIVASDIAEKAVGVHVEDIRGNCPTTMILLAVFGDTAAVETAMEQIRESEKAGMYLC